MPFHFNYVNNHIHFAYANRSFYTTIRFSKHTYRYVCFLKTIKYITNFYILNSKNNIWIKIELSYRENNQLFNKIKIISKPSHKITITFKSLKLLSKKINGTALFLESSKGLITCSQAIKHRCGGVLSGLIV